MTGGASRFDRDVAPAVGALPPPWVERLATVEGQGRAWPLYVVRPPQLDPSRPAVLVSGGVHGDEVAGVYAALRLLERERHAFEDALQFVVFPCINPSGFDNGTLKTASGANLNRLFGLDSDQVEVRAVETWLRARQLRFAVTFDLHEVAPDYVGEGYTEKDNPRAAYLYELASGAAPRWGRAMIDRLPPRLAVCDWPIVYDDVNDRGVITYPQDRRNVVYAKGHTFDSFLTSRYTDHAFTLETPTGWPLEDRVETQLSWIRTALGLLRAG